MFRTLTEASAVRNGLIQQARSPSTFSLPTDQLKSALRQLPNAPRLIPAWLDIRVSALYSEGWKWSVVGIEAGLKSGKLYKDPHVVNAATASGLCYALNAPVYLSHQYDVKLVSRNADVQRDEQACEREFFSQIKPAHATFLRSEFLNSWRENAPARQAAILTVLQPAVIDKLGLSWRPGHTEHAKVWRNVPPAPQLTEAELLALVDCLNSTTGEFNAVNSAALAEAYFGEPVLAKMVGSLSTALDRAIAELCQHPYFSKRDITAYKGINLTDNAGSFRRSMLEAAVGTPQTIVFPNVLFATSKPEKSYAVTKHDHGCSLELQFTIRRAFNPEPLYDTSTTGDGEILSPRGQKFHVAAKTQFELLLPMRGSGMPVDRFVLKHKNWIF